jgi:hypothetical protein
MALLEFLAAAAVARIVAADLGAYSAYGLQRMRVIMMVAMVIMLVIAIGTVHMFVLGIDCFCWLAG